MLAKVLVDDMVLNMPTVKDDTAPQSRQSPPRESALDAVDGACLVRRRIRVSRRTRRAFIERGTPSGWVRPSVPNAQRVLTQTSFDVSMRSRAATLRVR